MDQLFGQMDIGPAIAQRECYQRVDGTMEHLKEKLEGKSAAEQRAYLEKHHRDALEKFGDLLRPLNLLSKETDAQAVERLLNDMRREKETRCR